MPTPTQAPGHLKVFLTHRTTESNTQQGYVNPVMDSERGYLIELSLLYVECRLNIYSIIWRYLQLFEDIFKYLKISAIHLKISSVSWSHLQLFEDIFMMVCLTSLPSEGPDAVRVCRESNPDLLIHSPARYLYATVTGQPNLNGNCQLVCVKRKTKFFCLRRMTTTMTTTLTPGLKQQFSKHFCSSKLKMSTVAKVKSWSLTNRETCFQAGLEIYARKLAKYKLKFSFASHQIVTLTKFNIVKYTNTL